LHSHFNVSAILNTENGEFASLALIKGFRFKVALMEEHFNENYMESSSFPKAIVKGKLEDFSMESLSQEGAEFLLKGTITMHGVTQPLETSVKIKKNSQSLELQTEFSLRPEQFDIKIPSIVSNKIADEVLVAAMYSLSN
ncbi:MAG: YceI family protein, partial [Bacteroidota bacterium]